MWLFQWWMVTDRGHGWTKVKAVSMRTFIRTEKYQRRCQMLVQMRRNRSLSLCLSLSTKQLITWALRLYARSLLFSLSASPTPFLSLFLSSVLFLLLPMLSGLIITWATVQRLAACARLLRNTRDHFVWKKRQSLRTVWSNYYDRKEIKCNVIHRSIIRFVSIKKRAVKILFFADFKERRIWWWEDRMSQV